MIRPGPFAAMIRPRRKITPRSYSLRTFNEADRKNRISKTTASPTYMGISFSGRFAIWTAWVMPGGTSSAGSTSNSRPVTLTTRTGTFSSMVLGATAFQSSPWTKTLPRGANAFLTTPISPTSPAEPVTGVATWERNTRKATAVKKPEIRISVGASTPQASRLSGLSPSNSMREPNSKEMIPATLSNP